MKTQITKRRKMIKSEYYNGQKYTNVLYIYIYIYIYILSRITITRFTNSAK